MRTKNSQIFNIEEAYKNFVANTLKYYNGQTELITPDDMHEENCVRKDLLILMEELCYEFKNNTHCLFSIFNDWIINSNVNDKIKKDYTNFIFNLLENFALMASYKTEIFKWRTEIDVQNKLFREMGIPNLKAEDILTDKKLLRKISKKQNKNSLKT